MDVLLTRTGRTVVATGPAGARADPRIAAWFAAHLTYYSKHYDHGRGAYDFRLERLYGSDPDTGDLAFPLGLLPRVTAGLGAAGAAVAVAGPTLTAANAAALVPDVDGVLAQFQLFGGQDECLIKVLREDGGVFVAPTGAGKSVLIRMICRMYPRAKIHVVTRGASLADEIAGDLAGVVPNVGVYGGGRRRLERVTVFVADSLHHGCGDADVLLIDEVHEMVAPKYMRPLGRYTRAKVFGFTASNAGRHDDRDVEMEAVCGPVLYAMSYQEAEAGGRVVPIAVHWLNVARGPDLSGADPVTRDRYGVWGNGERNALIADYARGLGPDVQTMVMVKTIDHAVALKGLLPDYELVYAAGGMDPDRLRAHVAAGDLPATEVPMTAARLRQLRRRFADGALKKAIANYVWATGVNFRGLSVLIRADAAASAIRSVQIPGRVSRRIPGVKESAVLVDCWDAFDETLLERSRARRRSYLSRGWSETKETT